MKIQRATPFNELLAKLIFLILPTSLVAYFLIWNASQYYSIIGDHNTGLLSFLPPVTNMTLQLTLFITAGMAGGALFYSFRFRFLPTILLLSAALYILYKGLDNLATGEFDAFFISVQFLVFTLLFCAGWIVGWAFIRIRYFPVFISVALLTGCILLIAKAKTDSVLSLMESFAPALIYAVYIIFTSGQIYSFKDKSQKFWLFLTRRLVLFAALAALLLAAVYYKMEGEIEETVANYGGAGKNGKNSMLKEQKDGTFDLEDYTKLQGALGRNNELLFCAHIDNYFPDTEIPNPLYLTAFYYTKFDTLTETFERDSTLPMNDLFTPDPSKLPLFFTQTDSSVIRNSMGPKLRKTVEIEVYSKRLSPSTYLAPHTGFFVQPIAVEKDFRNEFKSAFRAKGYVSELNSAYFVYNAKDDAIRLFQQQRFDVLRKADGYERMDRQFMSYYTYMPGDAKFRNIANLANKVTASAKTPVDKVLAIRDWFLSKDENGEPLFKYTDNPGVPDIPSASKLSYFLFENRKGYCAYYAGATLFMLRALGIPSRIAVGFLTTDRSDKNKGWYWYYADQAHAWVQVYFPGYGWLDFDTTVGNSDAQESPQPDGTPPMQPPRAWLAADGIVLSVDTLERLMKLQVRHMVFHDKEYKLAQPVTMELDMQIAAIKRDSMEVPLASVEKGEQATAVSYAEAFKNMKAGNDPQKLIASFPHPAPIDEVYLKKKDIAKQQEKTKQETTTSPTDWKKVGYALLLIAIICVLLFLLLPALVYTWYYLRHRNAQGNNKLYWGYRLVSFYLHQSGIYRDRLTPMKYAREVVDPRFGTNFSGFMNIYLKYKYARQPLTSQEQETATSFVSRFIPKVRSQISWGHRLKAFMQPFRTLRFFGSANEEQGPT
ncbi:MAG: hypothetical protein EOO04_22770 [Chitinophagaceae bacterium]|nr:MAG: hypothetical protein EOO04_22770 [Chitinophagaceae bacterium]